MSDPELLTYQPIAVALPGPAEAGAPAVIDLPPPDLGAGLPLMSALSLRASTREFSSAALAPTTLGELLWAADGVNRPTTGGRTAPSAHAFNEIDIYAALPDGVYRYDAALHRLLLKHAVDARNLTGYQDFVGAAPLDLIYVVRMSRLLSMPAAARDVLGGGGGRDRAERRAVLRVDGARLRRARLDQPSAARRGAQPERGRTADPRADRRQAGRASVTARPRAARRPAIARRRVRRGAHAQPIVSFFFSELAFFGSVSDSTPS